MARVEAITRARVDNRRLRGDLRKTKGMFSRTFGSVGRGIRGSLGGALGAFGVGAGALGLAAIGKEVLDFEKTLADLEIQGDLSAEKMMGLRSAIDELSTANGQSRASLARATAALVNLQGAAGATPGKLAVLSKAALATGAPVEELAGLIFSLDNAFDLSDPAQLQKGLDAIIEAGKRGAIPLGEMNQILQQAGVSFRKFGSDGADGARDLASSLQFLRKGFGSASEAGTGLTSLLGVLETREVQLSKAGIKVRDSAGNFRPLLDIVKEIDETELVNNPDKFNKAFGKGKEARLALQLLIKNRRELIDFQGELKNTDTINRDVARRRETDAFKIQKAFNDAKEAVAKAFTPARIQKFARVMEKVADATEFMVDNAGAFVAVWAGFKAASLASSFAGMATSLGGSVTKSGVLLSNLSKAGGVLAAFGGGVAFGTALDQALGISDKISDFFAEPDVGREGSGFFRDRIKEVKQIDRDDEFSDQERRSSRQLLAEARRRGIVADGEVQSSKALGFAQSVANTPLGQASALSELSEQLRFALSQEKRGAIDVVVRVDPASGRISASETDASRARRTTN